MIMQNKGETQNRMFGIGILPLYLVFLSFFKDRLSFIWKWVCTFGILEAEFVEKLGLLTSQQLLDAVAVGQFTPGASIYYSYIYRIFVKGAYRGSYIGHYRNISSVIYTGLGIKSFNAKIKSSSWISGMLDGINIASLALMATVSFLMVYPP